MFVAQRSYTRYVFPVPVSNRFKRPMTDTLEQRYHWSPLFGANAPIVEGFYEQYLHDPNTVDPSWRAYFDQIKDHREAEVARGPVLAGVAARARAGKDSTVVSSSGADPLTLEKQSAVLRLIWAYRLHGHKLANTNPLALAPGVDVVELEPVSHGLTESDMDREFYTENLAGTERLKLREIIRVLQKVYTRRIGVEFAHLSDSVERLWLRQHLEVATVEASLSDDEKRHMLTQLTAAEGIERYLHTRYVGQKRFSLEGGESLIPMLDDLVNGAGAVGVKEIVVGMAHRGRINVLVNVLGKSPSELFSEFEGKVDRDYGSGDVKYHMGFSTDVETPGGSVHLALAFNPSHLEIVNPVVVGSVRARQDRRGDANGAQVMPVLVHGDAAFCGQGVVMETLQMSRARGFSVGGAVHIICNNQIGFTTSDPRDTRSTPYSSDVAKMLEAPVFHVNGDDPESVLLVTRVALEYRMRFRKDVVIDLVCYRRHGHNEADEPAATQPVMYRQIRELMPVRRAYAEKLVAQQLVSEEQVRELVDGYRQGLDEGRINLMKPRSMVGNEHTADWTPYFVEPRQEAVDTMQREVHTGLEREQVAELAEKIVHVPDRVKPHARVQRIYDDRKKMAAGELDMDWGFAETMAYASLLDRGYNVRLDGQDAGRGTFFHRHAVIHSQTDNETYAPLQHLSGDQGTFNVWDSLLSEEAVLGFEYGYATTEPECLVIWEAQFGDFANGAQVVIDQFISSGETKWNRFCGLVMFQPHGYEGQGPEHSSARLERYLQLCAEANIQVCVPSTAGQMFHMLRRQMLQRFRKPLVVMTPKSLLRHAQSATPIEELHSGRFRSIIDEVDKLPVRGVKRVVFCSGKVYYDLLQARRDEGRKDVAIVRVEQLYPFPGATYAAIIKKYSSARDIVWTQEEPRNQGAWYQIRHRLQRPLVNKHNLHYAGRAPSASPAVGLYGIHVEQQRQLVADALGPAPEPSSAKSRKKA